MIVDTCVLIPKYSFIDILKIVEAFDVYYFDVISGNVNIIPTKAGLDIVKLRQGSGKDGQGLVNKRPLMA